MIKTKFCVLLLVYGCSISAAAAAADVASVGRAKESIVTFVEKMTKKELSPMQVLMAIETCIHVGEPLGIKVESLFIKGVPLSLIERLKVQIQLEPNNGFAEVCLGSVQRSHQHRRSTFAQALDQAQWPKEVAQEIVQHCLDYEDTEKFDQTEAEIAELVKKRNAQVGAEVEFSSFVAERARDLGWAGTAWAGD